MPTYKALGVTATLRTCDLGSCLSDKIVLTMGADYQADTKRINDVLANGQRLLEQPVGADGGVRGVLQFGGAKEDMAMYVAEAGDHVRRGAVNDDQDEMEGMQSARSSDRNDVNISDDSSLTTLGDTPTSTGQSCANISPTKIKPALAVQPPPANLGQSLASRLALLNNASKQALVLEIQVSRNTFLGNTAKAGSIQGCKDLKVEVFVNGDLAEVVFIPWRKANAQDKTLLLSGTRIHRQVEKPWIYTSSSTSRNSSRATAQWDSVINAFTDEVRLRGYNNFGESPPSAEYLAALTMHQLPDRLRQRSGIGIIDIVITAGVGKKYPSTAESIIIPTRMDNPDYKVVAEPSDTSQSMVHTISDDGTSSAVDSVMQQSFEEFLQQSSPEIPLRQARKPLKFNPSPPKKTVDDLVDGLGIEGSPGKIMLNSYEKTSGRSGRGVRTLKQRLGDIGKMSPSNQAREMEQLKAELDLDKKTEKTPEARVRKKLKLDHIPDLPPPTSGAPAMHDPFVDRPEEDPKTISPIDMHKVWPLEARAASEPVIDPALTATDPEAVLTQNRIDMALGAGLPSNGALLRRIASTSPIRTPKRMTKASSLANSPTTTAVKPQTKPGRAPGTPSPQRMQSLLSRQDSPLTSIGPTPAPAIRLKATPSRRSRATPGAATPQRRANGKTPTPSRSGPGSNRTAAKWDPIEKDHHAALRDFRVPQNSVGSCVTYASDERAQRQIKKERPGMFTEEVFVVGMRFIVV